MPNRLGAFADVGLDEALLAHLIDDHTRRRVPELEQYWGYYRTRAESMGRNPSRVQRGAQVHGLPDRLTKVSRHDGSIREIVIENDIAWRIHTMVDFMFGKPITMVSTARDEGLRREIERALDEVWESSGGIALLQDMALLGHVYGHVDLALRDGDPESSLSKAAAAVRIEVIEPTRGIPVVDPTDYRRLLAYIIHMERPLNRVERESRLRRVLKGELGTRATATTTEVISAHARQVYENDTLIDSSPGSLAGDRVPVVHIQNLSNPFRYEGQGEVEAMMPLQDELNTRLSDRANRVTMQSFKMFLAKGLDGMQDAPVGPGQVWMTSNPQASIETFGGDGSSPSEDAHIEQIREALDKVSGVPPLASGVVRAKIGNLTSANALRITLMGILSKTARKRVTYGRGLTQMSELVLARLDSLGVLRTDPADRGVKIEWPDPLPEDVMEQVAAARAKQELGVPSERVLAELGYAPGDPGVT